MTSRYAQQRAFKHTLHQTLRWLKRTMQDRFAAGDYAKADELQQEFFALRRYLIDNRL